MSETVITKGKLIPVEMHWGLYTTVCEPDRRSVGQEKFDSLSYQVIDDVQESCPGCS